MQLRQGHIVVSENIDKVWDSLDLSENSLHKIDPNILNKKDIKKKNTVVGTTFTTDYKLCDKTYKMKTKVTHFKNEENLKKIGIESIYLNSYRLKRIHTLEKIGPNSTKISCSIERRPLKWYKGYALFRPGKKKPISIDEHLQRLKNIIENEQ